MFGGRHSLVIKFIAPYFFCLGAYSTKHEESKGLCSDTLAHTNSSVKSRHPHRTRNFSGIVPTLLVSSKSIHFRVRFDTRRTLLLKGPGCSAHSCC